MDTPKTHLKQYLFVIFLITLLLSMTPMSFIGAQEATPTSTETPTLPVETPTATVMDTPTLLPTDIPTETATSVLTDTPSATNTEPPTEDIPTETATTQVLPTEAPLSLLLSDNFDSGDTSQWILGSGWSVVPSETGNALQAFNSPQAAIVNTPDRLNVAVQGRFQTLDGTLELRVRESVAGYYAAILAPDGTVSLYRGLTLMQTSAVTPSIGGQWRVLRLSAIDNVVRVAVDSIEAIAVVDAAPLPAGHISIQASFPLSAFQVTPLPPTNTLLVDDVWLWLPENLSSTIPTSMVISTATPTPITTEFVEPTASELSLTSVLTEGFEGSQTVQRLAIGAGWSVVSITNGQTLFVSGSDAPTTLNTMVLLDVSAQVRVMLQSGLFRLSIRESGIANYTATLNANGEVMLYRANSIVGSGFISPSQQNVWQTITVSAVENVVRVKIDGQSIISFLDSAPLPPGMISFATIGGGTVWVDDFELSVPVINPAGATGEISFNPSEIQMGRVAMPLLAPRQQTQSFTFVERFDGFTLDPNEYLPVSTITGTALNRANPEDFGIAAMISGFPNAGLELDTDVYMGPSNQTYHVTSLSWATGYYMMNHHSTGATHSTYAILRDANNNILHQTPACTFIADLLPISCRENPLQLLPQGGVSGVASIRFVHTITAPAFQGSYYELYIDNMSINVEGTPPTGTQPSLGGYGIYILDLNADGSRKNPTRSVISTAVYQSINRTGLALATLRTNPSGQEAFRRIMLDDSNPASVDSTDRVIGVVLNPNRSSPNCQTYDINGVPTNVPGLAQTSQAAITASSYGNRTHQVIIECYSPLPPISQWLNQYTVTHELGHAFDVRVVFTQLTNTYITGTGTDPIMDTAVGCPTPPPTPPSPPCPQALSIGVQYVVMGNLDVTTPLQGHPTWIRGTRGWGSAQPTSDANLTDFQQHYVPPLPVNYTEALDVIRRETAADMFLNWVYRRTDTLGSTFSVAPGTWQGFLNMSWHPQDLRWSNCTAGCTDYSYPGDARYLWMQDVINQFDALYGW